MPHTVNKKLMTQMSNKIIDYKIRFNKIFTHKIVNYL